MDDWRLQPARDLELAGADRHRSYQRESGLVANVARFAWWSMIRASLKLLHRLEVHGRENLPESPSFVLVANHASHLDAMVLGATLPLGLRDQLFPLAAGDVFFHTPALAAFGALGAAVTVAIRGGGLLAPILIAPLCVPVLIFGVGAIAPLGGPDQASSAMLFLAALSLMALALSPFAAALAIDWGEE